MTENWLFIWGILLAFCAFMTASLIVVICWFSGWSVLLETLKDNLICWRIPIGEISLSMVFFSVFGARHLTRRIRD
ncbi:hypothetical protein MUP77_22730 [Candidatus Bathyarchaeota archaeon]|nr:hypothetical protein [Candidatus Bathyarchaeota archaeon]